MFQDFGLLTEAEFTKLCKTTPQAAGLNKKNAPNIRLSFNGPEGKQKYFLVGLQGLPCSEVHGMRKIRMRMTDSVSHCEGFLDPEKQVLQDQGTTVFNHMFKMANESYDASMQFGCKAPKNVVDYLAEKETAADHEQQQLSEAAARIAAAKDQAAKQSSADDFDALLDGFDSGDEAAEAMPARPKILPGTYSSSFATPSKPAPKAKCQSNSGSKQKAASQASANLSTTASGSVRSVEETTDSAGGKQELDPEMQRVAEKHLSTENCLGSGPFVLSDKGSSIKALYGLVPQTFLVLSDRRYAQSAKLRGAKQILENLGKTGHTQAAGLLKDRIAQCESCEILSSRVLKTCKPDQIEKVISATIGVELPCPIQVRVAEAHVIHKIVNVLDPKAPDDELVEGMKALARALCPKTKEQLRNERLMKFEAVNPRFDAVLYQLMDGVAVDSAFSHSPSGGMLALTNAPAPTTPVPEFNASGQIVLAALGAAIIGVLEEEIFMQIFARGLDAKKSLLAFSLTFLEGMQELMESPAEIAIFKHDIGAAVHAALTRVNKICRAIAHCFCASEPDGVHALSDEDAFYFQKYKDADLPEKMVAKLFNDRESFWHKETMEMIAKAGASTLTAVKQQELLDLLAEDSRATFAPELKQMADLLSSLRESCREQKLAHAKAAIEKLVGGTVDHHHVSSELSDVFLSALQHLPNEYPGVKEQREKIQVFFTDHRKQVGANDLLKLMVTDLQPDTNDIQKAGVFIRAVAGRRSELAGGSSDSCKDVSSFIQLWANLAENSLLLIRLNNKCSDVCLEDVKQHVETHGVQLAEKLVTARKEVTRLMNSIESLAKAKPTGDLPIGLQKLFSVQLPQSIHSALVSESFDDMVACKAALLMDSINVNNMAFKKILQENYKQKELDASQDHFRLLRQSWAAGLSEASSLEDMTAACKDIISKLPAAAMKDFAKVVQSDAAQSAFEDLQKACDLAIEMAQTSKIHTSHVLLIKATRNYHKGSADNDETAVSNNLSLIQHHAEFFRANSSYERRARGEVAYEGQWWAVRFPKPVWIQSWERLLQDSKEDGRPCEDHPFVPPDLPRPLAVLQGWRQHSCLVPVAQRFAKTRCLVFIALVNSLHLGEHWQDHLHFFRNFRFVEEVETQAVHWIQGLPTPYLAIHMRPYLFRSEGFNESTIEAMFLQELRHALYQLQRRWGRPPGVFLASESVQENNTQRLLQMLNDLDLHVITSEDTKPTHGGPSSAHVAIDVTICARASHFLGTATFRISVLTQDLRTNLADAKDASPSSLGSQLRLTRGSTSNLLIATDLRMRTSRRMSWNFLVCGCES
ncbi:unnamed protein product [Durusdinium trenchii]|uniref:Uncharacterized protein n=1 Tax=Durusdinium trenchii TaxID=1381693 RepID=A0ABP0KX44_9DINO